MESIFFDVVPAVKLAPKLHEVEIDLKTFQILGPYRGKMIRHSSDIADTIINEGSKIFTPTEMLIVGPVCLANVPFEVTVLR
jgi:hypothetical protein